ncbi:methanogenesis marker 5 protein [Methanopyrus sp.]
MARVFIHPPNSLILHDLVERFGHEPLSLPKEIGKRVRDPEIDSPPMNVTTQDAKRGLKYAAVEVPSGVRGRMALIGPLIEKADAAIVVTGIEDISFGCLGCDRTNEFVTYLVRRQGIPVLELEYPRSEEEAKVFVREIRDFLESL